MMSRFTDRSLLELGMVRPAQCSRPERSPWTGTSAVMTPFGPSAAHASSASSTSLKGIGSASEA